MIYSTNRFNRMPKRFFMAADSYKEAQEGIGSATHSESLRFSERYELGAAREGRLEPVQWSSILAGVFTTVSTATLLSVFGLALGLLTIDLDNTLRSFGIGAGIWGAVITLLSFCLGGWISTRTALASDTFSRILQGALVWLVTIPLVSYGLTGGTGAFLRLASGEAWSVLLSMVCGLLAAGLGGYLAGNRETFREASVIRPSQAAQPYH
jgi:hypothetical protein